MHCILCILFYALYFINYILCVVFYALYFRECGLCIVLYAFYSMNYNICIVLYALYSMYCILCIFSYVLYCILFIILYALYWQAQPQLQLAELALFSICPTRNNMEIAGNEQNLPSNISRYTLVELKTFLKILHGRQP